MARSAFSASFLRLPPATAVLLLSAAFGLTGGHALPRQTKTVELHELNVVPFPRPTEAPVLLSDLLRRQGQNTVCGYIGGDPNLPATCLAGSHCVLEQDHGVVGCCPDGGTCSTGIFTGCVDWNSEPQTEINPYVYTCQGSDVCYRNEFAGGYFQFGCGTASSLGNTVETSVDGMTSLVFEETSVSLTALPATLAEPTSIGSKPASEASDPAGSPSSDAPGTSPSVSSVGTSPSSASVSSHSATLTSSPSSSLSSLSTSSSSSSPSSSSTSSPSSTATTSPSSTDLPNTTASSASSDSAPAETASDTSAPAAGTGTTNRGAIIGGSISGAAVLIAVLIAIALFYLRKRRGNNREGPGPLPMSAPPTTEYISPRSHGAAFAPLPSWHDDEEDRRPLTHYNSQPYSPPHDRWQPGPAMAPAMTTTAGRGFSQPLRYHPATIRAVPLGVGTGLTPVAEEEQQHEQEHEHEHSGGPNASEIDDFSRAYSSAGIGTQGEDRQPLTVMNPDDSSSRSGSTSPGGSQSPTRGTGPGNRPLWQQNRRQGRNLMWL
ncbi:hypothetical protein F4677DRAFT_5728 [Hypoxylon crocopeplum]|nr:hypothetical protein F4677DRAFT_5728 [Hypoxylon crocopeplum]